MWDRHLLELLHLVWEEGHAEGQRWARPLPLPLKGWRTPGLTRTLGSRLEGCTSGLSEHTMNRARGHGPRTCGLSQGWGIRQRPLIGTYSGYGKLDFRGRAKHWD